MSDTDASPRKAECLRGSLAPCPASTPPPQPGHLACRSCWGVASGSTISAASPRSSSLQPAGISDIASVSNQLPSTSALCPASRPARDPGRVAVAGVLGFEAGRDHSAAMVPCLAPAVDSMTFVSQWTTQSSRSRHCRLCACLMAPGAPSLNGSGTQAPRFRSWTRSAGGHRGGSELPTRTRRDNLAMQKRVRESSSDPLHILLLRGFIGSCACVLGGRRRPGREGDAVCAIPASRRPIRSGIRGRPVPHRGGCEPRTGTEQ